MQDMSHSLHSLMPLTLEQLQTLHPAPQASVHSASTSSSKRQLRVHMARTPWELRAAQKLRWQVFAEELGARLETPEWGVDIDRFDAFCEHLIVTDEAQGQVVGTYRILSPRAAWEAGTYYSENEFDLQRLAPLRPQLVEIGRSCIAPDYRTGAAITLLWSGLAQYMNQGGYEHLVGCASISMADGGHMAANIYKQIREQHACPPEYRVFPHAPLPIEDLCTGQKAEVPPLIKGYLRAGAWVCGDPAWDPHFNTADIPMLLPMHHMSARYARHFLDQSA